MRNDDAEGLRFSTSDVTIVLSCPFQTQDAAAPSTKAGGFFYCNTPKREMYSASSIVQTAFDPPARNVGINSSAALGDPS
jgi:hypothetical protein